MTTAPETAHQPARRSRLPMIVGAIVVWSVLLVLSAFLWEAAFDFTREEAWLMSVALFAYLGLFIIAMLGISTALGKDH